MIGLQTLSLIDTPKTRVDSTSVAGYTFVGIAKSVSTKTTDTAGWAWYRITDATGDVDWAQKSGVPTNDFVFDGIKANAIALTYTEA